MTHHVRYALIAISLFAIKAFATTVDLHHLPLGDGKISNEPKVGWIWACHIDPNGRGAFRNGPWIHDDGFYDQLAKPIVQGDIRWTPSLSIQLQGENRIITTNDLPYHGTGAFPISNSDLAYQYDRNPNSIQIQNMTVTLPANPTLDSMPHCAPGAVGILLSGTVLFNALDAPGRDAVAHEIQDQCQGHPQVSGVYHYHSISSCVIDTPDETGHSALVGYALDGFGIYGKKGEHGEELTSADLDECHGHTHTITWDERKIQMYHYHATADFPYSVGCLKGNFSMQNVRTISGPPPMWRNRP